MYLYDEIDQTLVDQRVEQFRGQVARRLSGELSEDEFKPLRLMNGLYLQLHAYMLRVAIPYGVLSTTQLRALADISRRYDRGYAHFTTRPRYSTAEGSADARSSSARSRPRRLARYWRTTLGREITTSPSPSSASASQ